jgi:phage tail sheath gpL-like
VYVEQEPVNRGTGSPVIQHKVLAIGQYNAAKSPTDNVPQLILSKSDAWDRYGRGSQLSAMVEKILDNAGGSPVYALPVADAGGATAATGTIVVSGTATAAGTLAVYVNGIKVSVAVAVSDAATAVGDAIEAAVNANLDLPVTASNSTGTVTFTARWAGESSNQISLEINRADTDATPAGLTATVTDMGDVVAGATDPTLTTAFGNLGDTWYTEIAFPYTSDTALDALEASGVARVAPDIKRPFAGFVGYNDTYANLITALGDRNSEWTTMVPVHGSPTPPYMIAAATAAIFARYQQANPGRPMKSLILPGVIEGSTNDSINRDPDTVVKAGGSWTQNTESGLVIVGDLVTTRTTTDAGADTEDWRFTIIIPNLQFKIYALEQVFRSSPYDRAVVIADGSGPAPSYAITPKMVKARAIGLVDDWIERGLSTDRETIVAGIVSEINSSNPGRIDLLIPDVPSAGLRILAAKIEWAFVTG